MQGAGYSYPRAIECRVAVLPFRKGAMRYISILRVAYRALGQNKLRSFLTMLGIIIGVAAVIAMLAVGQGARDVVQAQIASLGTNVLIVFPGAANQGGVRMEAGTAQRLTEDDATAIRRYCPAVQYATPVVRTGAQVVAGPQNWRTVVYGVYPEYFIIRDWSLERGQLFTDTDLRGATKVCVIGRTVATQLFGDADPVGQTIRIRNIPFKVLGVLAPKGQNAFGQDQDDLVVAPFSTVQKRLMGITHAHTILVSARSVAEIREAETQIRQLLRDRHRLAPNEEDDFTVRTQVDIANAADATSRTMAMLLASIAGISLIVGGIGVMNIMLVSVTERTREIGIRMAVGAREVDIMAQFLIEAVVLSVSGGLIGIVLGVFVSRTLARFQGWPVSLPPQAIALAFLFAVAVGIFFGWYPARKAARLNPIEALRYE
jgi:putative ABC transport system permease protein